MQNPVFSFLNSDEFLCGKFHEETFNKFPYLRDTCNEISDHFVKSWIDVIEAQLVSLQPHQLKQYREELQKSDPVKYEKHLNTLARIQVFYTEKVSAIFASGFIVGRRIALEEIKVEEDPIKKKTAVFECSDCGDKSVLVFSKGNGKLACKSCKSENVKKWESATGENNGN